MNLNTDRHPDEQQLLAAVVDINDLAEEIQAHVRKCSVCSDKIKAYEIALNSLGRSAEEYAPAPTRRPQLPPEKQKINFFRPALAAAFTLAIVTWGVWWVYDPPQPVDNAAPITVSVDVWEDEAFMAEVSSLSENPIPDAYRGLLDAFDLSENEKSVPVEEKSIETQSNIKIPAMRGKPLC